MLFEREREREREKERERERESICDTYVWNINKLLGTQKINKGDIW